LFDPIAPIDGDGRDASTVAAGAAGFGSISYAAGILGGYNEIGEPADV
jgi:hypothetical protein